MKFWRYFLTVILFLSVSKSVLAQDIIQLEIVKPANKNRLIEAKIKNLSDRARDLGFEEVLVYGKKQSVKNSKIIEVSWYKIGFKNKIRNLRKPLQSRFNAGEKLVAHDIFKARGDRKFLAKEIESLFNKENPELKILAKEVGKRPANDDDQLDDNQDSTQNLSKLNKQLSSNDKEDKSSDTLAIPANAKLKSENCLDNEFTHDFAAGKSYRNKTVYYIDESNQRIDVAICKKSNEAFIHRQDSGGNCSIINDSINNQVIVQSKKYITVEGKKRYIGSCNPSPYKEIGFKWKGDFYDPAATIITEGVKDDIYLGSNQGEELDDNSYDGATYLSKPYDIEAYNKAGKCSGWGSITYNGQEIDLARSNKASIKFDNYIDYRQELPRSAKKCILAAPDKSCIKWRAAGFSQNSISYYQRCLNYRCPLSRIAKTPIYQRPDGTKFYDEEQKRESKYVCGNNMDGVEYYYNQVE